MTTPTRTLDGIEVPAPGRCTLDPGHAEVGFVGRHFMLTKVRGRFTGVEARVDIGRTPEESTVEVTIDMASVSSGSEARDEHLRSPDFFGVEQWPTATFRSTQIHWAGSQGTLIGDLTIRDVTRPVTLAVEYLGHTEDPWGNHRAIFAAVGQINREDWDLTWNMVLDSGGVLVSKDIALELHVELIRTE